MTAHGLDPDLAAVLTDPASHGGAAPEVIETHGAVVLLAGDRALKVKKPIDLGFFDFTSVEKRRAALEAELDLNARAAPQLYRRLAWVTRQDGTLAYDGAGERVEPVLEMARFDQDALYSAIAARGGLDLVEARSLAGMARESHAQAAPAGDPDGYGRVRRVLDPLIARLRDSASDRGAVDSLAADLSKAFEARRDLLDERARTGFVRRCHGDLHLNNIVRLDGRPVPFDALEFDDELATVDVLYDLAFLIADLARFNLRAQAATLTGQYLAGEEPGPGAAGAALIDPFCALRAAVRALTSCKRDGPRSEEGADWLALARAFAAPRAARLIAVGGLSGSGKSTLADALALKLGGPAGFWVIKSDVERKAALGLAWHERIPPDVYTKEAARTVYERQRAKAASAIKAGAAAVLDAVHLNPEDREAACEVARRAGVAFTGLWLDADRAVLAERVAARRNDPSDADLAVVDKQSAWNPGEIAWPRLDAAKGRESTLRAALTQIYSPGR
ncbi:MAG: AAA family ATPase [Oceanicaulis sp.]